MEKFRQCRAYNFAANILGGHLRAKTYIDETFASAVSDWHMIVMHPQQRQNVSANVNFVGVYYWLQQGANEIINYRPILPVYAGSTKNFCHC